MLAEECLEESKNLLSNGFYNCAVSRAYYSILDERESGKS
ncbi:MAG: hypothetical protein DRP00_03875 [Candidatus Aenigmatarchaeota archaeon]|nr:MAG: hypothetical protein DRP00_03875 [Candidatus Aenigmarchaeota archaeon]